MGLQSRLLALLLAFGVIPVALAMLGGYVTSREIILRQSQLALREYGRQQSDHLTTELGRQHLLLRTITGQLPQWIMQGDRTVLEAALEAGLADDGVFDGLRLVTEQDQVMAEVALRDAAPHWPADVPATNWDQTRVFLHSSDGEVVAYLVAAPITPSADGAWLEGHVNTNDFDRLFDLEMHPIGGVEQGILSAAGLPIAVPHAHSTRDLQSLANGGDSLSVSRTSVRGQRALVVRSPIAGTDWQLVAFLPLGIALAPMQKLGQVAALSLAALLVLTVLSAHFVARFVTHPLRDLALAALRFGTTGSYPAVEAGRVKETRTLVESFERMAHDLTQSQDEIEDLHRKDLERAQQLASVGELASGIAHEIRNPLTGVLGALDLAARSLPPDDPTQPLIAESQQQLQRIQSTTTQLLQYARPTELRAVLVDANLLVERARSIVAPNADEVGVQIVIDADDEDLSVNVDPELLVQVLVNLMLNGIQAMPSGGILSVVSLRDEGDVRIAVIDTGSGVPTNLRDEIFRPFFTSKNKGTGLGLSISKEIVDRHGGELKLDDSEADATGASFVVLLPYVSGDHADA